jgi:hypothetical protein
MRGVVAALGCSIAIAAVSTVGDFMWATWIERHETVYGVTHGALLFCAIGFVLGLIAGRPLPGAVGGVAIGAAAATVYYLLAPVAGFAAMFVVWAGTWVALAFLYAWLSRRGPAGAVWARGLIAAVASGLAFYLISGIWRPFNPQGWDYAVHFAAWTAAFFPGFAALFLARPSSP